MSSAQAPQSGEGPPATPRVLRVSATGRTLLTIVVTVAVVLAVSLGLGLLKFPARGSNPGSDLYAVTFTESGLPGGTNMSVTLNVTAHTGIGSVQFNESNGVYDYSIEAVTGYGADPSSGTIKVEGAPVNVEIAFTSGPYSLGMQATAGGASGTGANWFDSISLSPTSGLTTSMFGLSVTGPTGSSVTLAAAVGGTGCTLGATFAPGATGCNGPASGWYGVILTSGNVIAATYLLSGGIGTWAYFSGTTLALSIAYTLEVISASQLNGNDFTITAYSTGSSSVSGSGTL